MAERLTRKPGDQETLDDYLMYLRHLAAYNYVLSHFGGSHILDLGCGIGYGTKLIGGKYKVIGVDRATDALPRIQEEDSVAFCVADVHSLPFRDSAFDLAVSLQVMEHIDEVHLYLGEAHRVLSNRGIMVLSTPNRLLRLLPLERPRNPYHVREYSPQELSRLLKRHFRVVEVLGLHAVPGIETRERNNLRKGGRWYYRHLMLEALERLPLGKWAIATVRRMKRAFMSEMGGEVREKESEEVDSVAYNYEGVYSLEDFWVDGSNLKGTLDIIAVCKMQP